MVEALQHQQKRTDSSDAAAACLPGPDGRLERAAKDNATLFIPGDITEA